MYTKNISILGRDEKKIVLVDDREYSFVLNTESGILVSPFDGNLQDRELKNLGKFLIDCSKKWKKKKHPKVYDLKISELNNK